MTPQAQELLRLLEEDQREVRDAGRAYFRGDAATVNKQRMELKRRCRTRAKRALQILEEIGEPSISKIGEAGAQALSVLALHDQVDTLQKVLHAFTELYQRNPSDTYHQAIPSMTDHLLLLKRKPQRFATQWLSDKDKQPFLPSVENFEHVNERRQEYGIGPLRWPKSLAIPVSKQPWLKRPLSEAAMRDLTQDEYGELIDGG